MRALLVVLSAALFAICVQTAAAGNPSLCTAWTQAQSATGSSFSSRQECARAHEVYRPTLSITPTAVVANQAFTLTASGFHPGASTVVYFAITGQAPYNSYVPFYPTEQDGSFTISFVFAGCGNSPDDLTITMVDSFGVHASARLTLC